jgi:hypothetical protein
VRYFYLYNISGALVNIINCFCSGTIALGNAMVARPAPLGRDLTFDFSFAVRFLYDFIGS